MAGGGSFLSDQKFTTLKQMVILKLLQVVQQI